MDAPGHFNRHEWDQSTATITRYKERMQEKEGYERQNTEIEMRYEGQNTEKNDIKDKILKDKGAIYTPFAYFILYIYIYTITLTNRIPWLNYSNQSTAAEQL